MAVVFFQLVSPSIFASSSSSSRPLISGRGSESAQRGRWDWTGQPKRSGFMFLRAELLFLKVLGRGWPSQWLCCQWCWLLAPLGACLLLPIQNKFPLPVSLRSALRLLQRKQRTPRLHLLPFFLPFCCPPPSFATWISLSQWLVPLHL